MYRLMVYGLAALLFAGVAASLTDRLAFSAEALLASSAVIIATCFIADRTLPVLWDAASNKDSSLITALILCCIMPPETNVHDLALLALTGLLAIASKYILAYRYKHLFNPAAIAAVILGLTGWLPATWWIGSPAMIPATVIFGLIMLRKLRHFQLFFSFLAASLVIALFLGVLHHLSIGYTFSTLFKSSPLIFLGTVMLTEPATTPPRLWQQSIYGLIVGGLFTSQLRFGIVSATPELSLIVGNVYAYTVSPKYKLRLRLTERRQLAPQIYDLSFAGAKRLQFEPGQYLAWTLPQTRSDSRGNRRVFSIASATNEDEVHFAVKVPPSGSSFKQALLALEPGQSITAGHLAGDFVLPKRLNQKLVFIAGGIGITPFVSMIKTMIKTGQSRDITLLYLVADPADYCYVDVWQQAEKLGLHVIPILTGENGRKNWPGLTGRLTYEMLRTQIPDYAERRYYISGPNALVESYSALLRQRGIKRHNIVTDHFSGY